VFGLSTRGWISNYLAVEFQTSALVGYPKPQNVGTCYKMKYMNINVPPSQDFIEAKELKS
jgi:hypothetical protein